MSPQRDRVALADRLRKRATVAASSGRYESGYRLQALADAAQWLAAPLDRRDASGIRMVLSEAKAYRRAERRQRHAVLA